MNTEMGHFHFEIRAGSRSSGASASTKYEYISREGKYSNRTDLEHSESGNLPNWAQGNPQEMWRASDLFEGANRTVFREIQLGLPVESTAEDRIALVRKFVVTNLAKHPYSASNHNPLDTDLTMKNPHSHIEFCDRKLDHLEREPEQFFKRANKANPEKGGCEKAKEFGGKDRDQHLLKMRKSWADILNDFYKSKGINIRVDHRSLADQRLDAIKNGDLKRAVLLDREPDRRINTRRYRFLERTGQLPTIKDYRQAKREAAQAKAELLILRQEHEKRLKQETVEDMEHVSIQRQSALLSAAEPQHSIPIELSGNELHKLIREHYNHLMNLALQWEQEAQKYHRDTPLKVEQCEIIAKNHLLKQAGFISTIDAIETRHQQMLLEKQRMDKYYHEKFDISDKSRKSEKDKIWIRTQLAMPFSALGKEKKQFEQWRIDFNNRVTLHNKERHVCNSPGAKEYINDEVRNRILEEELRIKKHIKCLELQKYYEKQCRQLKPYKKCLDHRVAKYFIAEKFIVLGLDIESILTTKNLLQHLEHRLDLAKRLERERRSKEQGLSR